MGFELIDSGILPENSIGSSRYSKSDGYGGGRMRGKGDKRHVYWSLNIELCDLIDHDPGQIRDVMKMLKKRLIDRIPKAPYTLLLETLTKNCGDIIFQSILENDILPDIVNLVKTKPDWNVVDKALMLIDVWQEGLGVPNGRYPQYFSAYNNLKRDGVRFPPREETSVQEASVPFFTPATPQLPHSDTSSTHAAPRSSVPSDSSNLSVAEMKSARLSADLLLEMLGALEPRNPEIAGIGGKIIDLVRQCRSYQESVILLLNDADDEQILHQGLALNDRLQLALRRHKDLVKAIRNSKAGGKDSMTRPMSAANPNHDELTKGFEQIRQREASSVGISSSTRINPILPPPSSSRPVHQNSAMIDFLSGDAYTVEEHSTEAAAVKALVGSSTISSSTQKTTPPRVDNDPWEAAFPSAFDPAPSGGHQSLEQRSPLSTNSPSDHVGEPATSSDALTEATWKLTLGSSESQNKVVHKKAAHFDDLIHFAKFG